MSIKEYGFQQPIVVDKKGIVIAGHTRLKAAVKLNLDTCPVIVADNLSPAQTKAFRIADNKTGELAKWDSDLLSEELQALYDMSFDVGLTGFSEDELLLLIKTSGGDGLTDDNDVPDVPGDPICKAGDLWLLGDHRLLCGDSTKIKEVERLMDGDVADMVWTDPPYNVDYEGGTKDALKILNDNMSPDKFYNFLLSVYNNYFKILKNGGCIYVAHAESKGIDVIFRKAFSDSGLLLKQCLVWVKNSALMGMQDYNWQHEPILYGWKPGAAHWFCKNFKLTTVIDDTIDTEFLERDELLEILNKIKEGQASTVIWENKPAKNDLHPTMKPVSLVKRFIESSSKKNEIVADLFLGSGTTMIVCEKTNRKCYGMELDPHYCDVIIKRWEDYTGQTAVLKED